jgi:hypothetical protein
MNRFSPPLASLTLAVIFAAVLVPAVNAARHQSMAVHVLSSTGPRTVSRHGAITFRVRVSGLKMNPRQIGKPDVAGVGHLQYYLDRIPADAYRRIDLRRSFLAAVGTPTFIFNLKYSPITISPGRHTILIALAQNRYVLYRGPVVRVTITVK